MPSDAARLKRMQMLVSSGQDSCTLELIGLHGREACVSVSGKSDVLYGEAMGEGKERRAGMGESPLTLCQHSQSNINDPTFVFRSVGRMRERSRHDLQVTCMSGPSLGTFPCGHCSKELTCIKSLFCFRHLCARSCFNLTILRGGGYVNLSFAEIETFPEKTAA